jgi:hypothetical protein
MPSLASLLNTFRCIGGILRVHVEQDPPCGYRWAEPGRLDWVNVAGTLTSL